MIDRVGPVSAWVLAMVSAVWCAGGAGAADGPDLSSPKAAVKAFHAALLKGDAAGAQRCAIDQAGHREAAAALARVSVAMARLEAACQKRFSTSLASEGNPKVTLRLPDPNGVNYATVTGDDRYATVTWPGYQDDPFRAAKVGNEWRVDMTDPTRRTPEELQLFAKKLDAIQKPLEDVARDIDSGSVKSVEDARWAFLRGMMATNNAEMSVKVTPASKAGAK